MSEELLRLRDLRLTLPARGGPREILRGVDLTVGPGEAVGLVGESGSGKSMTVRAVTRLLPAGARVSGEVRLAGRDVLALDDAGLRRLRGTSVALVFQDPRAHVNPVHTVGDFLVENAVRVARLPRDEAVTRALAALRDVGIDDGQRRLHQYPHELSGGLLQRVTIAAALLQGPDLVLADEPTTALDVTTQEEVMAVLDEQRRERGMGMLFISHDLDLADAVCDRIAVMKDGEVVEEQPADRLRAAASHPYTVMLMRARPSLTEPVRRAPRPAADGQAPDGQAPDGRAPEGRPPDVLRVRGLRKVYRVRRPARGAEELVAVEGADLVVPDGGSVAVVGTSGSGKTTLAHMVVGLVRPTAGTVEVQGVEWSAGRLSARERRRRGGVVQMVFQDPYSSLDRRQTVRQCLVEVLAVHTALAGAAREARVLELLEQVGLGAEHAGQRPRSLSGGQRQRVAIARALAAGPRLLILDEAVAALDVSIQAQVLRLLERIRAELGVAYLFISHDLPVVRRVCEQVVVMDRGRVVESGPVEQVLERPAAAYTRDLIASVPREGWRPRRRARSRSVVSTV